MFLWVLVLLQVYNLFAFIINKKNLLAGFLAENPSKKLMYLTEYNFPLDKKGRTIKLHEYTLYLHILIKCVFIPPVKRGSRK